MNCLSTEKSRPQSLLRPNRADRRHFGPERIIFIGNFHADPDPDGSFRPVGDGKQAGHITSIGRLGECLQSDLALLSLGNLSQFSLRDPSLNFDGPEVGQVTQARDSLKGLEVYWGSHFGTFGH